MLLHYLVKFETPKMHVNATSAFNVNYILAVTWIKLHWQFHKNILVNNIINTHVRACVQKCPPSACTHDLRWSCHWLIAVSMMFWSKSNQVYIKRFRRSLMSWNFVSYTHCCMAPQISKCKSHDDPGPLDEAMIHLMQFSLVLFLCNITFSVFWLSQGSVATLIRWGEWS